MSTNVDLIVITLPTPGQASRRTVFFAPRLRSGGKLSDYPDWANWPTTLGHPAFDLTMQDNAGIGVPSTPLAPAPDPAVWNAVFPPDTPVGPYRWIDRSKTTLIDYPASQITQRVQAVLNQLANSTTEPPNSFADLMALPAVQALLADPALAQLITYARATNNPGQNGPAEAAEPDFHTWLSLLTMHPNLLRRLGLAIDVEINPPLGQPIPPTLRAIITLPPLPPGTPPGTNRRAAHLRVGTTPSVPGLTPDNTLVGQWLNCASPTLDFVAMGATEQALEFAKLARSLRDAAEEPTEDPGTGEFPLRATDGLALVRDGGPGNLAGRLEGQWLTEAMIQLALATNGIGPTLRQIDVTVGFRFDIWDNKTNAWHSLFQRTPDAGSPFALPPDEATAVPTISREGAETFTDVNEPTPDGPPLQVRVFAGDGRMAPDLVTWMGWSKAAQPPRRVFDTQAGVAVDPPSATPGPWPVHLDVDYSATPGTLPKLRYGLTYRIRGRAVNLSGTSLPPPPDATAPPEAVSDPVFFGRAKPVPAPEMMRRAVPPHPAAGESVVEVVLRSDYDIPDASVTPNERMVFPPRTDQWTCELHAQPNSGNDPTAFAMLAQRDAASLVDQAAVADDGELLWGSLDGNTFTPGPGNPIVPHLPDPASTHLAIGNAPGTAAPTLVDWNGTWPDLRGGRLVVRAGTAATEARPTTNIVARLTVPKAARIPITLSCPPTAEDAALFARWPTMSAQARAAALAGEHWMLAAPRTLRLVHAVRRPLAAPTMGTLVGDRDLPDDGDASPVGQTRTHVNGPATVHGPSTGALVTRATWVETIDDPDDPAGPTQRDRAARASQATPGDDDGRVLSAVLELGSTKRTVLSVETDAITDFLDYFEELADHTLTFLPTLVDANGLVASRVQVFHTPALPPNSPDRLLQSGVDYEVDAEAGTIRRLPTASVPLAAPVRVRYVAAPVLRRSTEAGASGTVEVVVPSSLAPPTPEITDVVPAFAARTRQSGQRIDVTRNGETVRVWLARPWFVTGDQERLAVLVSSDGGTDLSVIGRDPGALAGGPANSLGPANFANAAEVVPDPTGGDNVLVGFDVAYDAERRQWACDIELRGDLGYRPWLRLTLARWQADSLPGQRISTLVATDPMRLGLRREVSVRRSGRRVGVLVAGSDHDGVPDGVGGSLFNEIRVQPQIADSGVADPDLRWSDAGAATTLIRNRQGRWAGEVGFAPEVLTGDPVRLLVTETEPLPTVGGAVTRPVISTETVEIPAAWLPRSPGYAPGQPT